ncbi:hypothetical protein [Flexithrix dorotheae]|uniref:hypothetical protein n=1 Tax=Flexithrix dorotheae TaxID=70993 RepID=UPI00037D4289|nr:hypothetical protein [Flexithrix dorotheae]
MKKQKQHIFISWIVTLLIIFQQCAFLPIHQILEDIHNDHQVITYISNHLEKGSSLNTLVTPASFENDHCNLCDYFFSQVSIVNNVQLNGVKKDLIQAKPFCIQFISSCNLIKAGSRAPPFALIS